MLILKLISYIFDIISIFLYNIQLIPLSLYYSINQLRQVRAFNIVSAVVKVFEFTMNKVSSTHKPSTALEKSTGSTFAKNLIYKRNSQKFSI